MADGEVYPLSFSIGGQKYDIKTSVELGEMLEIIAEIDGEVSEFVRNRLTYQQALVLTSLKYAQSSREEKTQVEKYRTEIGDYLKDAADAKLECERLKRENDRLRKKLIANA